MVYYFLENCAYSLLPVWTYTVTLVFLVTLNLLHSEKDVVPPKRNECFMAITIAQASLARVKLLSTNVNPFLGFFLAPGHIQCSRSFMCNKSTTCWTDVQIDIDCKVIVYKIHAQQAIPVIQKHQSHMFQRSFSSVDRIAELGLWWQITVVLHNLRIWKCSST